MSLEVNTLKKLLHEEIDQLEDLAVRRRLQYLMVCSTPEKREQLAATFVEVVSNYLKENGIQAAPIIDPAEEDRVNVHVKELEQDGITRLGPLLSPQQAAEIRGHLANCPVFGGGTVNQGASTGWVPISEAKKKYGQCSYQLTDLIDAPYLLEMMASPFVISLATRYLGAPPTMFSPNLFWSFADSKKVSAGQAIHRDWDGFRHLAIFVYLVDVNQENGAHQYLKKSHTLDSIDEILLRKKGKSHLPSKSDLFYYHFDDQSPSNERFLSLFSEEALSLEGVAGEAFLVDPFGLHRGLPLIKNERLLFWARYGLYHNGNAVDVSSSLIPMESVRQRIPNDRLHRYVLRTFIESEFSELSESTMHLPSILLMDPPPRMHQIKKPGRLDFFRKLFSSK
ncbi:MAG: phytanoyl-CoA dioxygenase family protein [Planctomycetaceae bacterium]|nr:phytanoyl-CoA dioxygenase family protein [Planctomycetaceae bacterium]